MDGWHNRLASQLLGDAAKFSFTPDAAAALEIAFGLVRSELTYILEFGRTHRLPVAGNVVSDDIWFKLGAETVRFRFDRREGVIVASVPGKDERRLGWNAEKRAVSFESGEIADTREIARDAIEAMVAAWKNPPAPPVAEAAPEAPAVTATESGAGKTEPGI